MKSLNDAINFGRHAAAEINCRNADLLLSHVDARLERIYPRGQMPPELFAATMIGVIYHLCDVLQGNETEAGVPPKIISCLDHGKGW